VNELVAQLQTNKQTISMIIAQKSLRVFAVGKKFPGSAGEEHEGKNETRGRGGTVQQR
jgi:hypothetical protein